MVKINPFSARLRHARYYQQAADHANYLYGQGKQMEGLALFDQERPQIDAAWSWALEQPPVDDTDRLVLVFVNGTVHISQLRYDVRQERIPQLEAQVAAAKRLGEYSVEGVALGNLGVQYNIIGEYQKSIEYHEQSLAIAVIYSCQDTAGEPSLSAPFTLEPAPIWQTPSVVSGHGACPRTRPQRA